MTRCERWAVAIVTMWTMAGPVHAQDKPAGEVAVPAPDQPQAPTAPPRLLMAGLRAVGLGDALGKADINIHGYVEGGYFYDFTSSGRGNGPTFILFNSDKNQGVLDTIDLSIDRTVDPTKKRFDLGFHVEGLWGADAAFVHSNGLLDDQTGRSQWDLIQAYVGVALPGLPVQLRIGKWIELAGFEQFSANIYGAFGDPSRALYSYSYQFLYAEPNTQTGVLAKWVVNSQLSVDAGFTRGWNQSIEDTNHSLDFLGRVTFTPTPKTSVILVVTEGPEFPIGAGPGLPKGDNSHSWTAVDLVITHKATDKLNLGLGIDYVNSPHIPGFRGAQDWGGVAGYVSCAINPYLTSNTRVEWFHDSSGFATGAGVAANCYEVTSGMAIKPAPHHPLLPNVLIRPELRYDYADRRVFNRGDHDQLTFSVGALFTF